jgi:transcriptional regulator with XRE-family HTH domain
VGNIAKILAANIKAIREGLDLSQYQLADRAKISRQAVYLAERGDHWPAHDTVARISEALGVAEEHLYRVPESILPPTLQEALSVLAERHGFEVRRKKNGNHNGRGGAG